MNRIRIALSGPRHSALVGTLFLAALLGRPTLLAAKSSLVAYPAAVAESLGKPVAGAETETRLVLANEPESATAIACEFDLAAVSAKITPLARLSLGGLEKLRVHRPGVPAGTERGALHAFIVDREGHETLAGSIHVKPGGNVNPYTIDLTTAINAVLQRPVAERKVRLVVRIAGKPIPYEVYALQQKPVLEIASAEGWTDDWAQRVGSLLTTPVVYREACLPLASARDAEVTLHLLYPAKRVLEVIALGTAERLQEGRDWVLREGKVVLPAGSHAPVQIESEFFLSPHKDKDGTTTMTHTTVKLVDGPWYHERQVEVSYEPTARDWHWPAAISSLDQLPRTKARLLAKQPLTVILFGDSISQGFNSSRLDGVWPYQSGYGELVVRQLEKVYGSRITFMNHARAGDTAAHAVQVVDAQVAWFKPDLVLLAYGMNDRSPERRVAERANLEKIIDLVRARSPETEFVVITPMLNNSKQPTGLDPVKFIRDEELKIDRPHLAFVDITSTELALLDRKDYLDLSGNGANHPNDFLHRIYAQRVLEVLAPGH